MLGLKQTVEFHSKVFELVDFYKKCMGLDKDEAMDGDQTETMNKHIQAVIDLYQGNITFDEYLKLTSKLEDHN